MDLELPKSLKKALDREAANAKIGLNAHIVKKLEAVTPPSEYIDIAKIRKTFPQLVNVIAELPGVSVLSNKVSDDAYWWIKFQIDIEHKFAWQIVQELAFVLNEISVSDRLPTVFKPTSPPPYLNGGPDDFLYWVIESTYNYIEPDWIAETLQSRLPDWNELEGEA